MPIRTIELKTRTSRERRLATWFTQLKVRLEKCKSERDKLKAQGKMRPERLP
jgi:hypothetical protein